MAGSAVGASPPGSPAPAPEQGRLLAASMFLPVTCTLNTTLAAYAHAHGAAPPQSPAASSPFAGSYSATMERIRSSHTSSFGAHSTWGSGLARGASMGGIYSYARDTDVSGVGRDDDGGGYGLRGADAPDPLEAPPQPPLARLPRRPRHRSTPSAASGQDWAAAADGLRSRGTSGDIGADGDERSLSLDENESTLLDDGEDRVPADPHSEDEMSREANTNKLWKFAPRGGYSGESRGAVPSVPSPYLV
ncbi:hypothetical protein DFJ74DRAFT_175680 [Hyaloraphidium curvatum]|nr:hypothetical protein DFJ74DRAFT_175680 [Hyaloraphidium curvatum]